MSQVKSQISDKTYQVTLDDLYKPDQGVEVDLYKINIFNKNIMIAPGKVISEPKKGIHYCYVYAIKNGRVAAKLGVYETNTKKDDIYDLSEFDEGSLLLFDEYYNEPASLVAFEMDEEDIFDYLKQFLPETNNIAPNSITKTIKAQKAFITKLIMMPTIKKEYKSLLAQFKIDRLYDSKFLDDLRVASSEYDQNQLMFILFVLEHIFKIKFVYVEDNSEIKEMYKEVEDPLFTVIILLENPPKFVKKQEESEESETEENVESEVEEEAEEEPIEEAEAESESEQEPTATAEGELLEQEMEGELSKSEKEREKVESINFGSNNNLNKKEPINFGSNNSNSNSSLGLNSNSNSNSNLNIGNKSKSSKPVNIIPNVQSANSNVNVKASNVEPEAEPEPEPEPEPNVAPKKIKLFKRPLIPKSFVRKSAEAKPELEVPNLKSKNLKSVTRKEAEVEEVPLKSKNVKGTNVKSANVKGETNVKGASVKPSPRKVSPVPKGIRSRS